MAKKLTITGRQKSARRRNIAVARRARKKGSWKKGGSAYLKSTEAAEYLGARGRGQSKSAARKFAVKKAQAVSKRLLFK